jgi:hypothetical protein
MPASPIPNADATRSFRVLAFIRDLRTHRSAQLRETVRSMGGPTARGKRAAIRMPGSAG